MYIPKKTRDPEAIMDDWKTLFAEGYAKDGDHTDPEEAKNLRLILETLDAATNLCKRIETMDDKLNRIRWILEHQNKEDAAE